MSEVEQLQKQWQKLEEQRNALSFGPGGGARGGFQGQAGGRGAGRRGVFDGNRFGGNEDRRGLYGEGRRGSFPPGDGRERRGGPGQSFADDARRGGGFTTARRGNEDFNRRRGGELDSRGQGHQGEGRGPMGRMVGRGGDRMRDGQSRKRYGDDEKDERGRRRGDEEGREENSAKRMKVGEEEDEDEQVLAADGDADDDAPVKEDDDAKPAGKGWSDAKPDVKPASEGGSSDAPREDDAMEEAEEAVVEGPAAPPGLIEKNMKEKATKVYKDPATKRRNVRMFGALMGHLGKAKTRLQKDSDLLQKQTKVVQSSMTKQQAEASRLVALEADKRDEILGEQKKTERAIRTAVWAAGQEPLKNFLFTTSTPIKLAWLPQEHTDKTLDMLQQHSIAIDAAIQARKEEDSLFFAQVDKEVEQRQTNRALKRQARQAREADRGGTYGEGQGRVSVADRLGSPVRGRGEEEDNKARDDRARSEGGEGQGGEDDEAMGEGGKSGGEESDADAGKVSDEGVQEKGEEEEDAPGTPASQ
ncbi:unnamed protein product [Chrysoparadoxa australica]